MSRENVLLLYCGSSNVEKAEEFLLRHTDDVDILYQDGHFFTLAIIHRSAEMLELLLEHFNNKKSKCETELERNVMQASLRDAIENVVHQIGYDNLSEELKKIIDKCITHDDENSTDLGYEDIHLVYSDIKDEYQSLNQVTRERLGLLSFNEEINDEKTKAQLEEVYLSLKEMLKDNMPALDDSDEGKSKLIEFKHNLEQFIIESGIFRDQDIEKLGLFKDDSSYSSDSGTATGLYEKQGEEHTTLLTEYVLTQWTSGVNGDNFGGSYHHIGLAGNNHLHNNDGAVC